MKKKRLKITALLAAVAMIMTLIPSPAAAAVKYHEDVTAEMSKASYWSDKMKEPEKVLATENGIDEIQRSIYSAGGMNMTDLSKFDEMNAEYRKFFPNGSYPARCCVEVRNLCSRSAMSHTAKLSLPNIYCSSSIILLFPVSPSP